MSDDPYGIKHTWLKPLLYALPFGAVNLAVLGTKQGLFATLMVFLALVAAFQA